MARGPHATWQDSPTLLNSVLGSRRCRKAGISGEDVWPVHLEAALLEGLESYVPDESRETQVLGRFRGRNRFISNYILAKTGEHRSNKQVGSRLQQLRHCATDPKLRQLLLPPSHAETFREDTFSEYSESAPRELSGLTAPKVVPISIPILPPNSHSDPHPYNPCMQMASTQPRPLSSIVPTVTLVSPRPMIAQSFFSVWYDDECVHTETSPLIVLMDRPADGMAGYLHSAVLVPAFWKTIVGSPDPSKFKIAQDVVRDKEMTIAFSAEYRFVY
ncbi:hypothetical protein FB45DRAFT_1063799 [Roridomyces roridus]|uniref:TEA domain-containing protein n=1 Tax=Roridomyces roridus TaxID=1738132 RepID=A0AAD7BDC8_9AGAR|nr:hypothetical protein FB45DRAFT_1063799 [Roridomyces roridus]